jgi:ubiquinone/menaquinone biosynthesis C-methylase UbiE
LKNITLIEDLPFTGERFTAAAPLLNTQIYHEHLHRYLFAAQCVRGLAVLDIACGEGYGSALLAASAVSVVGVDVSAETIAHAERKYRLANLRFLAGECRSIPVKAQSIDVVVSFETIEHLEEHEVFMRDIRRVLKPGGLLIISSPDREKYEGRGAEKNPFHKKELSHPEFANLMRQHFQHVALLEQKLVAGSSLEVSADSEPENNTTRGHFRGGLGGGEFVPGAARGLYVLAVCSDAGLPALPVGSFENPDVAAQIWDSFEILPALRTSYAEAQQKIAELEAKGAEGKKTGTEAAELERQLRLQIEQLNEEVEQRGRWGQSLSAEIETLRSLARKQADELEAGRRDLRTLTVQKDDDLRALKIELVELGEQIERRVKEATTFQEMRLRAETMGHAEKLGLVAAHEEASRELQQRIEQLMAKANAERWAAENQQLALVAAHEADRLELRRRVNEMELNVARQREASEASEVAAVLVRGENERKHAAIMDLAKRLSAAESEAARLLAAEHEEKARLAGELQQLGGRLADQRRRYEDQLAAAQDQFAASLKENQQLMARLNSVDSEVTWNRAQLERWQQSDHNLRQMQTSWSWRVTAPLRKIHQWLGDPLYRRRR